MKIAVRRSLSIAVAMAITTSVPAFAGNLTPGQSATVEAGDTAETWDLRGAQLNLTPGASAIEINAESGSMVNIDQGTISSTGTGFAAIRLMSSNLLMTGSQVVNTGERALLATSSRATIANSRLVGSGVGASIATLGIVTLDGSRLEGLARDPSGVHSGTGAWLVDDATLVARKGSVIVGDANGLWVQTDRNNAPGFATVELDASRIEGRSGAAIYLPARRGPTDGPLTAHFNIRNGSELIGGDGNLLLVDADDATVDLNVDDSRLIGNVVNTIGSTLDVALRNKAQIDGRFINVTTASIDSDATWLMTGDSTVGHLTLGAGGTVALGNGSSFNTLSLDEFTGNGGTLLFNTQLGDDASLTDKLVIAGDANGQANVRVLNAGGAGAKTDRGIELIDIGGASNAQFDLIGRAVGGQYEYFLVKDANGNWYLRSELGGAPDPCLVDPTLPECKPIDPIDPVIPPPPILRPETGAYLANQFALDQMLRHTYRDRQGGAAAADGIRGWARVDATQSKLGAVDDQLDLRVDRSRLQLGADIGVFDDGRGRIGVMGTAARSSATSRSDLTGFSARGKVEGGALGVYGNWANDAMYVDASVQRGQFRNRVQGDGLAEERYDSDIWQSSVEAGYRFDIGQIGDTALSLQPELQLVYTNAKTDVHTETNGTVVRAAGNNGLSGRAGLRLQGESRSAAGASVSPYLAANWYRDGAGNGIAFDDEVLKAGIPRNRYELSAGARVEFRSGFSAWGGFGVMRGDSGYREATANLSVAYSW